MISHAVHRSSGKRPAGNCHTVFEFLDLCAQSPERRDGCADAIRFFVPQFCRIPNNRSAGRARRGNSQYGYLVDYACDHLPADFDCRELRRIHNNVCDGLAPGNALVFKFNASAHGTQNVYQSTSRRIDAYARKTNRRIRKDRPRHKETGCTRKIFRNGPGSSPNSGPAAHGNNFLISELDRSQAQHPFGVVASRRILNHRCFSIGVKTRKKNTGFYLRRCNRKRIGDSFKAGNGGDTDRGMTIAETNVCAHFFERVRNARHVAPR